MTARLVALAWVVVGLVGCTATPVEPDGGPTSSRPPAPQVHRDRDEEAVLAALRQLDPCALAEGAAAATPAFPATTRFRSREPFRCSMDGPAGDLTVDLVTLDRTARVSLPTVTGRSWSGTRCPTARTSPIRPSRGRSRSPRAP